LGWLAFGRCVNFPCGRRRCEKKPSGKGKKKRGRSGITKGVNKSIKE